MWCGCVCRCRGLCGGMMMCGFAFAWEAESACGMIGPW